MKNFKEETDEFQKKEKKQKNNSFINFDMKLKINMHRDLVLCLILLNDGRMASGSSDKSIIIYNKITFKPELIINEHNSSVFCLTQLSSGILATCSSDETIKFFNINGNKYKLLQTLKNHTNWVYKIIELKNKKLLSCSDDYTINIYSKDNDNKYKMDYKIETSGRCTSAIQTKDNEIYFSESTDIVCFYDLIEKKKKILCISNTNSCCSNLLMINKDLLLIGGLYVISILNVNQHNLIREINSSDSGYISSICLFNDNTILTGDNSGIIKQWKVEGDNLIFISKKKGAHNKNIYSLLNLGDGHIASCSGDSTIKIW